MGRLIWFELKKIFSIKKIIISAIVVLTISVLCLNTTGGLNPTDFNKSMYDYLKKFKGEVTEEKIEEAQKLYDEIRFNIDNYEFFPKDDIERFNTMTDREKDEYLSSYRPDMMLKPDIYDSDINEETRLDPNSYEGFPDEDLEEYYQMSTEQKYEYIKEHTHSPVLEYVLTDGISYVLYQMKSVNGKLDENLETVGYLGLSDADEQLLKNKLVLQEPLIFGYCEFYTGFLDFTQIYAPLLIGFCIIFFLSSSFTIEYSKKTRVLIQSSKFGLFKSTAAKLAAGTISAAVCFIFIQAVNIIMYGAVFGFEGWDVSLSVSSTRSVFWTTPYDMNMLQYLIYYLIFSFVGTLMFSVFVMFISSVFKSSIITFAVNTAAFFAPAIAGLMSQNFNSHFIDPLTNALFYTYPTFIQASNYISKFKCIHIFGGTIMIREFVLVVFTLVTIILIFAVFKLFARRTADE